MAFNRWVSLISSCAILLFFLLCLTRQALSESDPNKEKAAERVSLRHLQVITLESGKRTTGRRAARVPQLRCIGGTAGCSAFRPKVVQCYNKGYDGRSFQWECKAEMDASIKFGRVEVSCEGFDYPEDDYVLVGSCGLEYELDLIGERIPRTNFEHLQRAKQNYYKTLPPAARADTSRSYSTYLIVVFISLVVIIVFYQCRAHQHRQHSPLPTRDSSPEPPGFRREYSATNIPDPDGSTTWRGPSTRPSAPPLYPDLDGDQSYQQSTSNPSSRGSSDSKYFRFASMAYRPFSHFSCNKSDQQQQKASKPPSSCAQETNFSSSCSSSSTHLMGSSSGGTRISSGFGGTKVR